MRARGSLVWIVGILLTGSMLTYHAFEPQVTLLPVNTVVGVDGVCLKDTTARVTEILGQPIHREKMRLYFGGSQETWFLDSSTQVDLESRGEIDYVDAVYGKKLTDPQGRPLATVGTTARNLEKLLGRRDWIFYPWCGNDTNEYQHFKHWHLVVSVDRSSRRATGFHLEQKFPDDPPDGEINVRK